MVIYKRNNIMCKWGTDILCLVPIDPRLSYDGQFRWDYKAVDACIAPLINALNAAGIYTSNCCCGHGKSPGWITLHDGRSILVAATFDEAQVMCDYAEELMRGIQENGKQEYKTEEYKTQEAANIAEYKSG